VKRACARANIDLGLLDDEVGAAILQACDEVIDGRWDDQFPIDVFQTGSGTSTNMNANEVIANRAIQLLGGQVGSRAPVHPNDDVNLSQSSSDIIPTAIHVAATLALRDDLIPALAEGWNILSSEDLDQILDPRRMIEPGLIRDLPGS
jgi:fumarate hydratase class II